MTKCGCLANAMAGTVPAKHLAVLVVATVAACTAGSPGQVSTPAALGLPRKGLVAFWPADGGARDSAGDNHGTVRGGVTFAADRHGRKGGAFVFDGKSGYVLVPDRPQLDTDDAFTLSAWVKPAGYLHNPERRNSMVLSKWCSSGVAGDYILYIDTSGLPLVYVMDRRPSPILDSLKARSPAPVGVWTHVAATFDRGKLAIYVNGRLDASKDARLKHTDRREYEQDSVVIGGYWRNGYYNFHGAIDEVCIWDRALSAVEITDLIGCLRLPGAIRLDRLDRVAIDNGNLLLGTILNQRYRIMCALGQHNIPAEKVAGLVVPVAPGQMSGQGDPDVQLILTDGQALTGRLPGQVITLRMGRDSTLKIPIRNIRQFGYRISKARPARAAAAGAMVVLRNGDHLRIAGTNLNLAFQADWGMMELPVACLGRIGPPNPDNSRRRVRLANGSRLTGTLAADKLTLRSTLGVKLAVEAKNIRWLTGTAAPPKAHDGAAVMMHNGDSLVGRLVDKTLTVLTKSAPVNIDVSGIAEMRFDEDVPPGVTVRLWNSTTVRGSLAVKLLTLRVADNGPAASISTARITRITRAAPVPPPDILNKVEKLIARLGADSYKDREAATKELIKMGKAVALVLKRHANSPDAEVRRRIEEILRQIDPKKATPVPPPDVGPRTGPGIIID